MVTTTEPRVISNAPAATSYRAALPEFVSMGSPGPAQKQSVRVSIFFLLYFALCATITVLSSGLYFFLLIKLSVSYLDFVLYCILQPWTLTWVCGRLLHCWTSSMRSGGSSLYQHPQQPIIITASRWLTYRWGTTGRKRMNDDDDDGRLMLQFVCVAAYQ